MGAGSRWHWALECSALLINHNQPCAITSIFLVNYCEGQVVPLRTEPEVCGHRRNIWCGETPRIRTSKRRRWTQETNSRAHLQTCRQPNGGDVLSPPVHTKRAVRQHPTTFFPAVRIKSRKTIRGYDYDLLLPGCKIRAFPAHTP